MFEVKVEGVEAVVKMLRDTRGKKANAALRKGTRAGCKIIAARAKQLIPEVQRRDRAGVISIGKLRKAVTVRAIKRNRKGWIGSRVAIDGNGLGYKGEEFYGAFVEFGTKKMKAREYFKTAAKDTETAAVDEARKVIVAELSK